LGRRVTSTRNCAGITSRRSDTSSPILAISPQPQGHSVLAGSITRSTRGRWRADGHGCGSGDVILASLALEGGRRLLLGRLQHALGQFNVLERQVELVGSELLGLRAELLAAQLAEHALEPALCLLGIRQSRLEVRKAGLQGSVFLGENSVIHALFQSHGALIRHAKPPPRVTPPQSSRQLRPTAALGPNQPPVQALKQG
jgi:hypothetical protein